MAVTLTLHEVLPVNAPEHWRHPLSLVVEERALLVIRTVPALGSRLFRLVLGAERPASGSITVLERAPGELSRHAVRELRSQVGSVLIPDGLVGNMTVWRNLALPLIFASGMDDDEVERRIERVVEAFGLDDVRTRRPANLPADARQIVALARAVVGSPSLLLLDDPLASVGTVETGRLIALCRHFAGTVITTTHRRNTVLYDNADDVALWDEHGYREAGHAAAQVAS
ncbi:MAG: ATP-binding cassette domain-containing protein [Gemmatimonadota bacterium]|nr:ATP-binding cassette domain-containing protein [Gemmatimonadota bacterium]